VGAVAYCACDPDAGRVLRSDEVNPGHRRVSSTWNTQEEPDFCWVRGVLRGDLAPACAAGVFSRLCVPRGTRCLSSARSDPFTGAVLRSSRSDPCQTGAWHRPARVLPCVRRATVSRGTRPPSGGTGLCPTRCAWLVASPLMRRAAAPGPSLDGRLHPTFHVEPQAAPTLALHSGCIGTDGFCCLRLLPGLTLGLPFDRGQSPGARLQVAGLVAGKAATVLAFTTPAVLTPRPLPRSTWNSVWPATPGGLPLCVVQRHPPFGS